MKQMFLILLALLLLVGALSACTEISVPETQEREEAVPNLLFFNTPEPEGSMNISPGWYGAFSHDLTEEELRVLFPYLDLPFEAATVHYKEDGTVAEFYAWMLLPASQLQVRFWLDGFSYDLSKYIFANDLIPQVSNIHGTPVTAYMIEGWGAHPSFRAEFMMDDFVFRVLFSDYAESGQVRMREIVEQLILGGMEGLEVLANPEIPELRSEALSLEEARLDPDFGRYVPTSIPEEARLYGIPHRSINQHENILRIEWEISTDYEALYEVYTNWIAARSPSVEAFPFADVFWGGLSIRWNISVPTEYDLARVVSADERQKYDWSLYPLVQRPNDLRKFHEIPGEYSDIFHAPVFLAEEFNFDMLQAREMIRVWIIQVVDGSYLEEMEDIFLPLERYEFEFGVLFDDALVQVSATGVSAAQLWTMFADLM